MWRDVACPYFFIRFSNSLCFIVHVVRFIHLSRSCWTNGCSISKYLYHSEWLSCDSKLWDLPSWPEWLPVIVWDWFVYAFLGVNHTLIRPWKLTLWLSMIVYHWTSRLLFLLLSTLRTYRVLRDSVLIF